MNPDYERSDPASKKSYTLFFHSPYGGSSEVLRSNFFSKYSKLLR